MPRTSKAEDVRLCEVELTGRARQVVRVCTSLVLAFSTRLGDACTLIRMQTESHLEVIDNKGNCGSINCFEQDPCPSRKSRSDGFYGSHYW
jgi:hypothetical protein